MKIKLNLIVFILGLPLFFFFFSANNVFGYTAPPVIVVPNPIISPNPVNINSSAKQNALGVVTGITNMSFGDTNVSTAFNFTVSYYLAPLNAHMNVTPTTVSFDTNKPVLLGYNYVNALWSLANCGIQLADGTAAFCSALLSIVVAVPTNWADGTPIIPNNYYKIFAVAEPCCGETDVSLNYSSSDVQIINVPVDANGNNCTSGGCQGVSPNIPGLIAYPTSDTQFRVFYASGGTPLSQSDRYEIRKSIYNDFHDNPYPLPFSKLYSVSCGNSCSDLSAYLAGNPGTTYYFQYRYIASNGISYSWSPQPYGPWATTPSTISNPSPANNATNVSTNLFMSGSGGQISGKSNTYTYYWGINGNFTNSIVQTNPSLPVQIPSSSGKLLEGATYSWKVQSTIQLPNSTQAVVMGPTWNFRTVFPPNIPNTPSPGPGAGLLSLTPTLSWNGGQPDGNPMVYDIFLGKNVDANKCPLRDSDAQCLPVATIGPNTLTSQSFTPTSNLIDTSTYYWKIVARSTVNADIVQGPTWWFFTLGHSYEVPSNADTLHTHSYFGAHSATANLRTTRTTLTAWTEIMPDNSSQIRAQLVDANTGNVINPNLGINSFSANTWGGALAVHVTVASDGNNFLIVYFVGDGSSSNPGSISAILVNGGDGSIIKSGILIAGPYNYCQSVSPAYLGNPAIAFAPGSTSTNGVYMVVFEEQCPGNSGYLILGTRIDMNGNVLDQQSSGNTGGLQYLSPTWGNFTSTNINYWRKNPTIACRVQECLVAWNDDRNRGNDMTIYRQTDIYGVLLGVTNAMPITPPTNTGWTYKSAELVLSDSNSAKTPRQFPALASDGNQYLLVWQSGETYRDPNFGSSYDTAIPTFIVTTRFSTTANSTDIWGSIKNPLSLSANSPENKPISIAVAPSEQWRPAVAFGSSAAGAIPDYLVVWQDLRDDTKTTCVDLVTCDWNIYGAWVSPAGIVLDNLNIPFTKAPYGQMHPSVVFGYSNYMIFWDDNQMEAPTGGYTPRTFAQGRGNANFYKPGLGDDITPPSIPQSLVAVAVSASQINLSWLASTDNVGGTGVKGYSIYRNGIFLANTSNISYSDTGLISNTTYSYTVAAFDGDNNVSSQSASVTATTLSNIDLLPTAFGAPASSKSGMAISITDSIKNQGTGDSGPFNVNYYLANSLPVSSGALLGIHSFSGGIRAGYSMTESFSLTIPFGTAEGNYYLGISVDPNNQVIEYDKTNNIQSLIISVDNTAPTVPSTLGAFVVSNSQINLSWNASTDNVGVVGYFVERCQGVSCSNYSKIAASITTTYSDTNLSSATNYSYRVRATDAAGNFSGYSNSASATTLANPPTVTTGSTTSITSSGVTLNGTVNPNGVNATAWFDYGLTNTYGSSTATQALTPGSTAAAVSAAITGLTANTTYHFRIDANNNGGTTYGLDGTFTTLAGTTGSTTLFSDNFSSGTATQWTPISGIWTAGALSYTQSDTTLTQTMTTAGGNWANLSIQADVKINTSGGNDIERVVFQYIDINNWSSVYISNFYGVAGIDQWVNGVETWNEVPFTPAIGTVYTLKAVANGGQAWFYINGVLKNSLTLSNAVASGSIGLSTSFSNVSFANILVQTLDSTSIATTPVNLTASAVSSSQNNLTWGASADNAGIAAYLIERCQGTGCTTFTQIGNSLTTSFSDTNLTATTSYSYRVKATNVVGNASGYSNVASATTMNPPVTLFTDNFASGTATQWTPRSGTWTASALSYNQSDTTLNQTMTTAGGNWANITLQGDVRLNTSGGNDMERIVFRYIDPNNWSSVYISLSYGIAGIDQWVNGVETFSDVAFTPLTGTWYTLKAFVSGSQVQLYINGTLKNSWTLPNGATSGSIGLSTDQANADFTNITVTTP